MLIHRPRTALSEYSLKKPLLREKAFFPLNRNVNVYFTRNNKLLFFFNEK